ncbi:hypothetical protein [Burkholderia ubonensis]|uniref:hypothetical protein n=1 Tax=Burkholderia ubonensis TaxID=101571 RepID=UPI000A7BB103|nr:hypothetical protein [Burkholderia ubonensis]
MKLLKYVMTSDSGPAVNPCFAICSLAMCAPNVLLRTCWICLSSEAVDLRWNFVTDCYPSRCVAHVLIDSGAFDTRGGRARDRKGPRVSQFGPAFEYLESAFGLARDCIKLGLEAVAPLFAAEKT